VKIDEQKVIDTYKNIIYSREWFKQHEYVYRFGQNFDPYIGEYFLVDLYFDIKLHDTEIWLVKGCKPKYDNKRKCKLPFEPIVFIDYNKQYGTVNGYWQLTLNEAFKMFKEDIK
jgi:hypothetical protein